MEYDWDQTWTRAMPDQAAFIDWAKRITHFRAGVARDYLIYGRMLRPWKVSGVTQRDFGWGKEPLVQSATWQARTGAWAWCWRTTPTCRKLRASNWKAQAANM